MENEANVPVQSFDRKQLEDIARDLQNVWDKLSADPEAVKELRPSFELTQRAIRLFGSLDTMIIVICGMLKAGKSTLINLLARSNMASPVDFGVDTTMRPAVVRMSESSNGCIRCYYTEGTETEGAHTALRQVFDVLRNVPLEQPARFTEEAMPLNQQNLKDFLCGSAPCGNMTRDPLLVVVEIPVNQDRKCLLSKEIVLLDMPGLDSANASIATKGGYDVVVKECDMMFYVQSSVSPLNSKAEDLLKQVLEHRHSETAYIIQNCMMAQMWRTEEQQRSAEGRQAQKAREDIHRCFRQGGADLSQAGVACFPMNLGMAYDAIVRDGEDIKLNDEGVMPDGQRITAELLAERSRFLGFEDKVCEAMQTNRRKYREQHCLDSLTEHLDGMCKKLRDYREQSLARCKKDANACWKGWKNVQQELKSLRDRAEIPERPQETGLSMEMEQKIKAELSRVWEDVWKSKEEYKPLKNKCLKVKGGLLDEFWVACSSAMSQRLTTILGECELQEIKVILRDGSRRLSEFVNDSLSKAVYDECSALNNDKMENSDLFREVDVHARAGYSFEHARRLNEECETPQFQQLGADPANELGYPFKSFKFHFKFDFWERNVDVGLLHDDLDKLVGRYLSQGREVVAKYGASWLDVLFKNGKRRGMEAPLKYAADREEWARSELALVEERIQLIEGCNADVQGMKQKMGGLH